MTKRGQISAEMIIVLAILLGLIFIVATRLQETAKSASETVQQQSQDIFSVISETAELGKKQSGEYCSVDSECMGGSCLVGACQ